MPTTGPAIVARSRRTMTLCVADSWTDAQCAGFAGRIDPLRRTWAVRRRTPILRRKLSPKPCPFKPGYSYRVVEVAG